jgi:hypothetical protein
LRLVAGGARAEAAMDVPALRYKAAEAWKRRWGADDVKVPPFRPIGQTIAHV